MTRHILLLIAFAFLLQVNAQKPERIYSFVTVYKSTDYYKEQQAAWKKVVEKNPKDANAWYNYYRVTRNLIKCDTSYKTTWEDEKAIVEKMAIEVPESYEYNFVRSGYEGSNWNNSEYISYLKKADELSNGRTLHLDLMVKWGEIERNIERRDKYCRKWYETGEMSPGFLYYNYNVLAGLKPNAILFTVGDNDTYPAYILQSQGIRRDVTVVNMYLLHFDEYRAKLFKELGIEKWDLYWNMENNDSNWEASQKFDKGIIKHVASNKKKYPVYLAVTGGSDDYLKPIEEKLYLTGLAYEYSDVPLDNMAMLKRNFEQVYALDYIQKAFYKDISRAKVKEMSCNYVIPMLKLYEHYKILGDRQRMDWIKELLVFIYKDTPQEQALNDYFDKK